MVPGHTELPGRPAAGLSASLTLVILGLLIGPTHGIEISVEPLPTYVNDTALMKVNDIVGTIQSVNWYKGEPSAQNQILGYIPSANPPQTPGSSYIENAAAFPNATLSIPRVQISHSGTYTVQVLATKLEQANVTLTVNKRSPPLPPGAIAGISLAVIFVCGAAVGGGVVYYKKHKSNRQLDNPVSSNDANSYGNVEKQDND